jgi:hypothetical protein
MNTQVSDKRRNLLDRLEGELGKLEQDPKQMLKQNGNGKPKNPFGMSKGY